MKVLKATLAFVLGIFLGIILLLAAVAGTVAALGATRTVGELQSSVTDQTIISPDSELYGQTVLEAVQKALKDYQNFDNISLKLLYERYGVSILNGISGLDFTKKSFYDKPITDIINDLSILLDDIYLSDIGEVADLDFLKYNIPIIDENMNVGLTKAIDNIMNLVNGDLSLRLIQNKLGFDFGVENNGMLQALQDVNLKEIGGLIDALEIGTLLEADCDMFVPKGRAKVYVGLEGTDKEWEPVSKEDLENPDYAPPVGVETYIAGGLNGKLVKKEMRYFLKADGTRYADNSCYNEGWTCPEGVTVLRHRLYQPYDGDGEANGNYFAEVYVNSIESCDPTTGEYVLKSGGFLSFDDIIVGKDGAKLDKTLVKGGYIDFSTIPVAYKEKAEEEGAPDIITLSPEFSILDEKLTDACLLRTPDEDNPYISPRAIYLCVRYGASTPILQYLSHLTIGKLRTDTDSVLKNVRIGDIVDTDDPDVADILKALKDCTLENIGEKINTLQLEDIIDVDKKGTAKVLKALRHSSLETIGQDINNVHLGDMVDVGDSPLLQALANSTLETISKDVEDLELGQIITIDDSSASILKALKARHAKLSTISTIVEELTVGELMDIDYDLYEEDDENGAYVRVPFFVEYNDFLDVGMYGPDAERGTLSGDEFTPNADGDSVRTYYYVLYDEKAHAGQQRYAQTHEGTTALAVQSLAKRGIKALDMGDHIEELTMAELLRMGDDSAYLFKSLARRGSTLKNLANVANDLTIGEIVEIGDDSSQIMKSLAARNCTLDNMDKITDQLTLSEILTIVSDVYTRNDTEGKYVRIFEDGYVPYDSANPDHADRPKFEKQGDEYVPHTDGDEAVLFVHSAYYTLYNPAVHNLDNTDLNIQKTEDGRGVARFDMQEADPANPSSSKILQRFAGSTMGGFSTAFDELMLSDVMDIDPDIYAEADKDKIQYDAENQIYYYGDADSGFANGRTLYKYDEANQVYSVADQNDLRAGQAGSIKLYEIARLGGSASILKKLAYVKVGEMSNALNVVMKDMMLSEIIDIHAYDAIKGLTPYTYDGDDSGIDNAPFNGKDSRYYLQWDGKSMINEKPIVYVYETTGKYMTSDKYYHLITDDEASKYLGEATTGYYKYVQFSPDPSQSVANAQRLAAYNVYVLNKKSEYEHNVALATYYATATPPQWKKIYYREECGASEEGATAYTKYENIPDEYSGKIFVEILGEKNVETEDKLHSHPYVASDLAFCDMPKYVLINGSANEFIVSINEPEYNYKAGETVRIGTQYAREVMIHHDTLAEAQAEAASNATTFGAYGLSVGCDKVYVFIPSTNTYEAYDEGNPVVDDPQYYTKRIGYVAQYGEVFYEPSGGKCVTRLKFDIIGTTEREHSSKVLTLLAGRTINDMNSAITDAKIENFMDVTPGTIFDDETIRNSTIDGLGTALAGALSQITIGKLIEWGSITSLDAQVLTILNNVTLTDFFGALTYSNGAITFDMEKLYGIKD